MANAAKVRFISPLASVAGSTFAIGVKVEPPDEPVFRSVKAPMPRTAEIHGDGVSAFEIGDVLQSSTAPSGIAAKFLGHYVIKLTDAGPLAPDAPALAGGAIDSMKLHDVVLEIGYSLA